LSYVIEFKAVDLLLNSDLPTKTVDAFSLSLIKAERQIRRIFTYTVFQSPSFGEEHIKDLRSTLSQSRFVYFEGLVNGFNQLSEQSLEQIVGGSYEVLRSQMALATKHRNKIFHGQLTNSSLGAEQLLVEINNIKSWCSEVAEASKNHIGYCGFARNSFKKSDVPLNGKLKHHIPSIAAYSEFISNHMENIHFQAQR